MNTTRLLGIDYGSRRIGVALTNETGEYALPHSVVQNSSNNFALAVSEIIKICQDNGVQKVVVGESKDYSGADNVIMNSIREFVGEMEKAGYEVVLHPEFLTSAQAERLQGKNAMLDASAATIILQSYIDIYGK